MMPLCPPHMEQHIAYEPVKGWFTPARLPKAAENLSCLTTFSSPQLSLGAGGLCFKVTPPTVSYFDSLKQKQHGGRYVEEVTAYLTEKVARKSVQDQSIECKGCAHSLQSATFASSSNDCGVLMLHYMQELSMAAGSVRYALWCALQRLCSVRPDAYQCRSPSSGSTRHLVQC